MADFIDEIEVEDWEVETDTGWETIMGIGKTIEYDEYVVRTDIGSLICADIHILFDHRMREVYVKDLQPGDKIQMKGGIGTILSVTINGISSHMYDLQLATGNHRYYTNGFLSHNSIFLWNIAYRLWYNGAHVAGASLEMAGHKIAKRIGANMFGIDMKQYGKFANNETVFNEAMQRFKGNRDSDNLEMTTMGDLYIKRFGGAKVADLAVYVDRIEQKTGQKVNALVLDYATELNSSSGLTAGDKMYQFHKENCNELFEMAVEQNLAMITAHQLHVKFKGDADVTLQMISESSAIAQRPDMIYGLIHTDIHHQEKKFQCKLLKGRDTGGVGDKTEFEINWERMNLIPYDNIIDAAVIH